MTTQLLIRGHEDNVRDGVFRQVRQSEQRDLLQGDFKRVAESKIGEWSCNFDIILGKTPADVREG